MKNVIVSATALASSGGLSILKQFLEFASTQHDVNFYIYVPDSINFNHSANIYYIPVSDKNWLERILWDFITFRREIRKLNIDFECVISLQNTGINISGKKLIYIQQSIPFSNLKIPVTIAGIKIWLYKKFYSYFIFLYSTKSTTYFVQTEWMRESILKNKKICASKIMVMRPTINLNGVKKQKKIKDNNIINILYPATPFFYKQHDFFIDIINDFKKYKLIDLDIKIHFTFKPESYPALIKKIKAAGMADIFVFHGFLKQDKLYDLYNNVDLIMFPSQLETVGLPLLEAAYFGKPIFVSNQPYAHEVLRGYAGAYYLNNMDANEWSELLYNYYLGNIKDDYQTFISDTSTGWELFRSFF